MSHRLFKAGAWFLAVLFAGLSVCPESEARCRIFGRRHARRCCPAPTCSVPSPYSVRGYQRSAAQGAPRVSAAGFLTDGIYCPTFQTSFKFGDYYYFYVGKYDGTSCPYTEPGYFEDQTCQCCINDTVCIEDDAKCPSGEHACWGVRSHGRRPDSLADHGHSEMGPPAWAGRPIYQRGIDFGGALGVRSISFHKKGIFHLGFEHPGQGFRVVTPQWIRPWQDYARGFKVKFTDDDRIFFVVLSDE